MWPHFFVFILNQELRNALNTQVHYALTKEYNWSHNWSKSVQLNLKYTAIARLIVFINKIIDNKKMTPRIRISNK